MITLFFPDAPGMLEFAARLAKAVASEVGDVPAKTAIIIFLHGPLGAGKTTLARGFLQGLGHYEKVKSPTYTLVEPYIVAGLNVFHFDFYRLQEAKELDHIGIQDYFLSAAICLIEWPEKGGPLLPPSDLSCHIAFKGHGRELRLEAHSEQGEKILKHRGLLPCDVWS
jgi:tRNA threonylcarbamoyladenosine biosynthesis protein TsaE